MKRTRTIPPHVVACKVCDGRGIIDGHICEQCKGSGRVIVTCDVVTYVMAFVPETL
ncbi:molecular chaperone DnaJ [Parabacteroides sp. CH2-D42-20]|nr:molecular chaperone DnaJ [Parabacteroides sp. CH2-D42-20]